MDRLFIIEIIKGTTIYSNVDGYQSEGTPLFGITAGSMNLEKILCEGQLEFGNCNSTKFEAQLFNTQVDLGGAAIIILKSDDDETPKRVFTGKIDTATKDRSNEYRDIVAYDAMYFVRDIDISDAWNGTSIWPSHQTPATLKTIRENLCSYVGILVDPNQPTLPNDDLLFDPQFNTLDNCSFSKVLKMICELQGSFPIVNELGILQFVPLNSSDGYMLNQLVSEDGGTIDEEDIPELVEQIRAGKRPYAIGSLLNVITEENTFGLRIRGYDCCKVNGEFVPSMLVEFDKLYNSGTYDASPFNYRDALYVVPETLVTDTNYKFTVIDNPFYTADNNVVFYFTLPADTPAGAHIVLTGATSSSTINGKTFTVYGSSNIDDVLTTGTITKTVKANAIDLGQTGTDTLNNIQRVVQASNNYGQSGLRQAINLPSGTISALVGANTKFGMKRTYEDYINTLPDDYIGDILRRYILTVDVPCRTNHGYESPDLYGTDYPIDSVYTVKDKFFIPSRPELLGTYDDSNIRDGEEWLDYIGRNAAYKIKYNRTGDPFTYWLRTPSSAPSTTPPRTSTPRTITTTGAAGTANPESAVGLNICFAIG